MAVLFCVVTSLLAVRAFGHGYYTAQTYCFDRSTDTNLNCATPYSTKSYDSESSCTSDCQGYPSCKAAVYRTQAGQCQLYQIAPYQFNPRGRRRKRGGYSGCGYRGPQTVTEGGYNYYQWNDRCPRRKPTSTAAPYTTDQQWTQWTPAPTWATWTPAPTWATWTPAPTWATWTPAPTWATWTPAPTWATWTPAPTWASWTTTIRQRPTTTTSERPLPAQVTCFAGEVPRYLRIENYQLVGSDDMSFTGSSSQCITACSENRTPDGQVTPCLSFEYEAFSQTCTLSLEAAEPTGSGLLAPASGISYYEKMCMPQQLVESCEATFDQLPQTILVGFAQGVTTEASYQDCIRTCLDAQNIVNFRCISGQYYYDVDAFNCVLNTESKDTQPGLITRVDEDLVNYFDFRCANLQANPLVQGDVQRGSAQGRSLLNLFDTEWSHWSTCNNKKNRRLRFRNCKTHSPASCDKQEEFC